MPTTPTVAGVPQAGKKNRSAAKEDRIAITLSAPFLQACKLHAASIHVPYRVRDYRKIAIQKLAEYVSYSPVPDDYGKARATKAPGVTRAQQNLFAAILLACHGLRRQYRAGGSTDTAVKEKLDQFETMEVQADPSEGALTPAKLAEFEKIVEAHTGHSLHRAPRKPKAAQAAPATATT